MSTSREVRDYLTDILESIANIREFTRGLTCSEFTADKKTNLAVIRCLEVIGEATKKIPADLRSQQPSLPWAEISGMRDKLIHDYFGVDLEIVWTTVENDLGLLEQSVVEILRKINRPLGGHP
jgi:uncharacterized protein with HEPN domain